MSRRKRDVGASLYAVGSVCFDSNAVGGLAVVQLEHDGCRGIRIVQQYQVAVLTVEAGIGRPESNKTIGYNRSNTAGKSRTRRDVGEVRIVIQRQGLRRRSNRIGHSIDDDGAAHAALAGSDGKGTGRTDHATGLIQGPR